MDTTTHNRLPITNNQPTDNLTVSTIIVSYNTAELTCQAIQSILDNYTQDKIDGEIIVVDNNSSDKSVSLIQNKFGKKINLIQKKQNLGFAKANNLAFTQAKGAYIFFFNSDAIAHSKSIKNLLKTYGKFPDDFATNQLENSQASLDRIGIISGQLLNADRTIQPQGGAIPSLLSIACWWLWPLPGKIPFISEGIQYHWQNADQFLLTKSIGWLGGTAMMIRREVLDEIGTFDENIFMYSEDVDLCWRARKHHWDVVFNPAAKFTHLGSASGSSKLALTSEIKNLLVIGAKHLPLWQINLMKQILVVGTVLRWGLFGILLGNEEKKTLYQDIYSSLQIRTNLAKNS